MEVVHHLIIDQQLLSDGSWGPVNATSRTRTIIRLPDGTWDVVLASRMTPIDGEWPPGPPPMLV